MNFTTSNGMFLPSEDFTLKFEFKTSQSEAALFSVKPTLRIMYRGNVWNDSQIHIKLIGSKARCRCAAEDSLNGLSICATSENVECSSSIGCNRIDNEFSSNCACKPFNMPGTNEMTFDECKFQCERIGMKIPSNDEEFAKTISTGCGWNNKEIWIDIPEDMINIRFEQSSFHIFDNSSSVSNAATGYDYADGQWHSIIFRCETGNGCFILIDGDEGENISQSLQGQDSTYQFYLGQDPQYIESNFPSCQDSTPSQANDQWLIEFESAEQSSIHPYFLNQPTYSAEKPLKKLDGQLDWVRDWNTQPNNCMATESQQDVLHTWTAKMFDIAGLSYKVNKVKIFGRIQSPGTYHAEVDLKLNGKQCDMIDSTSSEYVEYDCKGQTGNSLTASREYIIIHCGIEVYGEPCRNDKAFSGQMRNIEFHSNTFPSEDSSSPLLTLIDYEQAQQQQKVLYVGGSTSRYYFQSQLLNKQGSDVYIRQQIIPSIQVPISCFCEIKCQWKDDSDFIFDVQNDELSQQFNSNIFYLIGQQQTFYIILPQDIIEGEFSNVTISENSFQTEVTQLVAHNSLPEQPNNFKFNFQSSNQANHNLTRAVSFTASNCFGDQKNLVANIFMWKEWQDLDDVQVEIDVDVCNQEIIEIPVNNQNDHTLYPVVYTLGTDPLPQDMQISDVGNNGTHIWFKVIANESLISYTESISFKAINQYGRSSIIEIPLINPTQNSGYFVHNPSGDNPGCHNQADRPLVCGGQPLDEQKSWVNNDPCCCAINESPNVGNYWQVEFTNGFVTIDSVQFLGRPTIPSQSNGLQIKVHTHSGWVHCDTTSYNGEISWQTYTQCRNLVANRIRLQRVDENFITNCGFKVFGIEGSGPIQTSSAKYFGSKNKTLDVSITIFGWQDDSVITVQADKSNLTIGAAHQVTINMQENFIGSDAQQSSFSPYGDLSDLITSDMILDSNSILSFQVENFNTLHHQQTKTVEFNAEKCTGQTKQFSFDMLFLRPWTQLDVYSAPLETIYLCAPNNISIIGLNNLNDNQISLINYTVLSLSDTGMDVSNIVQDTQSLNFTFEGVAEWSKVNSTQTITFHAINEALPSQVKKVVKQFYYTGWSHSQMVTPLFQDVELTGCHQDLHNYCNFEQVETFELDLRKFSEFQPEISSLQQVQYRGSFLNGKIQSVEEFGGHYYASFKISDQNLPAGGYDQYVTPYFQKIVWQEGGTLPAGMRHLYIDELILNNFALRTAVQNYLSSLDIVSVINGWTEGAGYGGKVIKDGGVRETDTILLINENYPVWTVNGAYQRHTSLNSSVIMFSPQYPEIDEYMLRFIFQTNNEFLHNNSITIKLDVYNCLGQIQRVHTSLGIWWACKQLCPNAWTVLEINKTVEQSLQLFMAQNLTFEIEDPDPSTTDCPITYELSGDYHFVNSFTQHTHRNFTIEFEAGEYCEFHYDKVPVITIKAQSVCRIDVKTVNIQLNVSDICWCEDPKLIKQSDQISSQILNYHMRNQTKVIPLDIIQVYNEKDCGNISQVQYELCSREYQDCIQSWVPLLEYDQHNLTIDLEFDPLDEVWKIEVYGGMRHTQFSSIQFEIRSKLAYSQGWSPTKYFYSNVHINTEIFIDYCILQSMQFDESKSSILQRDGPLINWPVYPKQMPVFLRYDYSQFVFDPPCEYTDIKVNFEIYRYQEPEMVEELEEGGDPVTPPCPSLEPLEKYTRDTNWTNFIHMVEIPKKGPSNTTIEIYPLSEEDDFGCYQLIPQLRFQEPMYFVDDNGHTSDFKKQDKDWLAGPISNYKDGVSNIKTLLVDVTPPNLLPSAPRFIESPDSEGKLVQIGDQTTVSICRWLDTNVDEVLVTLEIESYEEILSGKEQTKTLKKVEFGQLESEVTLVPGEKSEGKVIVKVDARIIQNGEFESSKIKGVVTLDDQTGYTVQSSIVFILDCGSNQQCQIESQESKNTFKGVDIDQVNEQLKKQKAEAQKAQEPPSPEMSVGEMNSVGEFQIDFNQDMYLPPNLLKFDYSSLFELVLRSEDSETEGTWQPFEFRRLRDLQSKSLSGKQFSWFVTEHTAKSISIQLKFGNPIKISSSSSSKDELAIKVIDETFFASDIYFKTISFQDLQIPSIPIPAQVSDVSVIESAQESGQIFESTGKKVAITNFIVSRLLNGSKQALWGMMNAMQMIIYGAMVSINFPIKCQVFLEILCNFAKMDLFDLEGFYERNFEFIETEPFSDKFENMGFESKNFLLNSGSLMLFLIMIFVTFFFQKACNFLAIRFHKYSTWRKIGVMNYQTEFSASMIRLIFQAYIDFFICISLSVWELSFSEVPLSNYFQNPQDGFCSICTIIFFWVCLIFPIWAFIKIYKNFDKLDNEDFQELYGSLYADLKTNCLVSSMYHMIFLARRFIIVTFLLFAVDSTFFQVMSFLTLSLINLGILINFRPFQENHSNQIEILNEFTIYLCNTATYCILNDGTDEEFKASMGDQLMLVCILNMLINLAIVVLSTITQSYRKLKDYFKSRREAKEVEKQIMNDQVCVKYFAEEHPEKVLNLKCRETAIYAKWWKPQRDWCKLHGICVKNWPEEKAYKKLLKESGLRLREKLIAKEQKYRQRMLEIDQKIRNEQLSLSVSQKLRQSSIVQKQLSRIDANKASAKIQQQDYVVNFNSGKGDISRVSSIRSKRISKRIPTISTMIQGPSGRKRKSLILPFTKKFKYRCKTREDGSTKDLRLLEQKLI